MPDYATTRDRVETYFDRTATKAWERLTSDAPVSRIRQTVREGRDRMRALMLAQLPQDLRGARVLDAGCGTGMMTEELAQRGATVTAADISPKLVEIAHDRLPPTLRQQVTFHAGDMTDPRLGAFDAVVAMDSLIHYEAPDMIAAVEALRARTSGSVLFTFAPSNPLLETMHFVGKAFPRGDRSPAIAPVREAVLRKALGGGRTERISAGFYTSQALEVLPA